MICAICKKTAMYTVDVGGPTCEECIDKAKDKLAFKRWMAEVDRVVEDEVGMSVHELPDCTYRDWFDDETDAEEAAYMALEQAGWRDDLTE